MALQCSANGDSKVGSKTGLSDIAGSPSRNRRRNKVRVIVDGKKYDLGSTIIALDKFRGRESVSNGHGNIGYQDVRIESKNRLNGLISVCYSVDNLEFLTECTAHLFDHLRMIVGKHHSNLGHGKHLLQCQRRIRDTKVVIVS